MQQRLYAGALALCLALHSAAAPVDKAKQLFLDGQYEEALPALQALHKKSPRDGNTSYYLGATLAALGRCVEAEEPLLSAENRGVADASRILAEIALDDYRPADASGHIDKWEAALRKKRNVSIPDALESMQTRAVAMRNMMERVEKIEIIDSITVDAYDFFTHYRLSAEAGKFCDATNFGIKDATVIYCPQSGREILWTATNDSTASSALMAASILDDGSIENSGAIHIDMEADAMAYPFLMPDGVTLYFAADGPNSIGGYDIFMTRRTDEGEYLQPQNIGMPYNSPANDYLLVIDEAASIGWWATDRNAADGKVTIYEFIPSQMRVNVEPDAADLTARARVSSIDDTQEPDKDYDAIRRRVSEITGSQNRQTTKPDFVMAMGNGRVYHRLSDFRSGEARRAMESLIGIDDEITAICYDLDSLRDQYRSGNTSVKQRIRSLENELDKARTRRRAAANKVIRIEQRQNTSQ